MTLQLEEAQGMMEKERTVARKVMVIVRFEDRVHHYLTWIVVLQRIEIPLIILDMSSDSDLISFPVGWP